MNDEKLDSTDKESAHVGHELSDVSVLGLMIFVGGLAVSLVLVLIVASWVFNFFEWRAERHRPDPSPLAEQSPPSSGPLLQESSTRDLERLRARENRQLQVIEWIDKDQGIARIPIDRAIEVVVTEGLPQWPRVDVSEANGSQGDRDSGPRKEAQP